MVNYPAVLLAAIAMFIIGWLWYGPMFGKQWRALSGHTSGAAGNMGMGQAMIGGFLSTLILVYVFAKLLSLSTPTDAVSGALIISVGVIAMTLLNAVWYENRPWKLFFINAGYYVVGLVVAALVLFYW